MGPHFFVVLRFPGCGGSATCCVGWWGCVGWVVIVGLLFFISWVVFDKKFAALFWAGAGVVFG